MGDERPSYGAGDGRLEILRQSTAAAEPCESSFDDPSAWEIFETPRRVGAFDDFDRPFAHTFQRLAQFLPGIAAVSEDMAQPWIERADRGEHAWGTIAILNAGFMHDEPDQMALRVGDDMTLAALDLLACVIAPRAAALRGFHRLAVNHSGRRTRLSASRLALSFGVQF